MLGWYFPVKKNMLGWWMNILGCGVAVNYNVSVLQNKTKTMCSLLIFLFFSFLF